MSAQLRTGRAPAPIIEGRPAPAVRRLPPPARKLALTVHVIAAVGWLGVVAAMLVLGLAAVTNQDAGTALAAYTYLDLLAGPVVRPIALVALVSGVILSLGTHWGLFRWYWIVAKLVVTVVAIATGNALTSRWPQQILATAGGMPATSAGSLRLLVIYAAVAHVLLLGAATVLSVYKPWGRADRFSGRRGRRRGRT